MGEKWRMGCKADKLSISGQERGRVWSSAIGFGFARFQELTQ